MKFELYTVDQYGHFDKKKLLRNGELMDEVYKASLKDNFYKATIIKLDPIPTDRELNEIEHRVSANLTSQQWKIETIRMLVKEIRRARKESEEMMTES